MTNRQSTKRTYRPRRKRSNNPPALQITPRDIYILQMVARYRFLNSKHITLATEGSPKNIRNRLKALFEHNYLDRPECQYDYYRPGGGSSLVVYALGDKGAQLLMQEGDFSQGHKVSWKQKNKQAGRPFLDHTLAIADFAVRLHTAVRHRPDIELLDGDHLLQRMPEETRNSDKPYRLNVPVIFKGTRYGIGVEPDYVFSLGFPREKRRVNFLCEIDRGTMPVARKDLNATSILRKFLAYSALWSNKMHTKHFGWNNFRVLMLTKNTERVDTMLNTLEQHIPQNNKYIFWFGDKKTCDNTEIMKVDWIDGGYTERSFCF